MLCHHRLEKHWIRIRSGWGVLLGGIYVGRRTGLAQERNKEGRIEQTPPSEGVLEYPPPLTTEYLAGLDLRAKRPCIGRSGRGEGTVVHRSP